MKAIYRFTYLALSLFPKYWDQDLSKLSKAAKLITAARYWLCLRTLD